jgi:hypothetical protein
LVWQLPLGRPLSTWEKNMTHLIADDAMLAVLNQVKELTEIRDVRGNVIGFYAPKDLEDARQYVRAVAHIDPAEIERRKAANLPGRTTREVFEHLKSLTKDEQLRGYLDTKIKGLTERDACHTP